MKVHDLEKMCRVMGFYCPKKLCRSKDTELVDSITTNISGTTAETRRCKKCGHTWIRYY